MNSSRYNTESMAQVTKVQMYIQSFSKIDNHTNKYCKLMVGTYFQNIFFDEES